MSLRVNLTELERNKLNFRGELSAGELQLEGIDELIAPQGPLRYDLVVEKLPRDLMLHGELSLPLRCECARCLRPFIKELHWPAWEALLPLVGEEKVPRHQDWVDLTPFIREDILLGFPQHPLCKPDCPGLPLPTPEGGNPKENGPSQSNPKSSAWAELNKLKL